MKVAFLLVPVDGSLGARLCALLFLCMISSLNCRVLLLPAYMVIVSCKAVKDHANYSKCLIVAPGAIRGVELEASSVLTPKPEMSVLQAGVIRVLSRHWARSWGC